MRSIIFLLFLLMLTSCTSTDNKRNRMDRDYGNVEKKHLGTCVRYVGRGREIIEPCDR